ncbi:hypothetical protein CYMTET_36788 [Cymbomonas tetramitiformis]|uniref:Calcineurin-like phosphoesterase domain-containing protein n=1 Tax=Cymbomonas tetramitiformis TaxID=36881 RepID=A0AAE0CGI1_9CHLO|nr:hypothetical protein CYMTET_36788 [Cymbomonas tetramitiformis]
MCAQRFTSGSETTGTTSAIHLGHGVASLVAARKLRFLHITDVHLDMDYAQGEESNCVAPPCCRKGSIHQQGVNPTGGSWRPARSYGENQCDTPAALLQSALDAAQQLHPDFIVWGGDTAPHATASEQVAVTQGDSLEMLVNRQRQSVLDSLGNATAIFTAAFPHIPVLPSLGDMDHVPTSTDPGPPRNAWLLDAATRWWAQWLPEQSLDSLKWGGYYEVKLPGSELHVVVLNTEVCHVQNFHSFVDGGHAAREQLAWLEGVLLRARLARESCLITGHIPPGVWGGCWGNYSSAYQELVSRYTDVVAGQLYGHQHSGSFRMLRHPPDPTNPAFGVAYVTPSLTPYKDQHPSFRLYELAGKPYVRLSAAHCPWPDTLIGPILCPVHRVAEP